MQSKILFFTSTVVLLLIFIPRVSHAEVSFVDAHFRSTYDKLDLMDGEEMGLLGTNFLIDQKTRGPLTLYSGLGIYSAVEGERGGFFTGGLEIGGGLQLGKWVLDMGIFLGGGGGGGAPQGGGLMLRPHVSILHDFGLLLLGLNFNKIKFLNGEIDSNQLGFQLDIPFQMVFIDGLNDEIKNTHLELSRFYIASTFQQYRPRSNTRDTRQQRVTENMGLIGIEVGRFTGENTFVFAESSGAFNGSADGFAELLGGMGYRFLMNDIFSIRIKGAIGAGGGGNVDTAGGLIYKLTSGASFLVMEHLSAQFDYGRIDAAKGSFHARVLKAGLSYQFALASPSAQEFKLDPKILKRGRWSIRATSVRYLSSSTLRKSGADDSPVDLFYMKLDRYVTDHIYLTGQAGTAYHGDAGGYATGLFGIGYQHPLVKKVSYRTEVLGGAGGGGGIASDGGSIVQAMAGLQYGFSKRRALQLMLGRVIGLKGNLETTVVDMGLVFYFNTIEENFNQ